MVDTQKKQLTKPTTVLLTHAGTDRLRLEAKDGYRVTNFKEKYYSKLVNMEKLFLLLVLLDAIFTGFKFSNMPTWAAWTLRGWQVRYATPTFMLSRTRCISLFQGNSDSKLPNYFRRCL